MGCAYEGPFRYLSTICAMVGMTTFKSYQKSSATSRTSTASLKVLKSVDSGTTPGSVLMMQIIDVASTTPGERAEVARASRRE